MAKVADQERVKPLPHICELCGEPTDVVVGCCICGRLVCAKCEAAREDQDDEPVCIECY